MVTTYRAIVMRQTGGPEVLRVEQRALAPLAPGEVRLRALASAVNHSDLRIRAGDWPIRRAQRFPYVPGLEVVGAASTGDVSFDLWSLLDGRSLTGYSSEDLDGPALRTATQELLGLELPSPPITVVPLAEVSRAHAMIEQRELRGRLVLVP